MPIGVNVDNPQEQQTSLPTDTATGSIAFGGNINGSAGASTTATATTPGSSLSFSTILLYGAIALVAIWILKKIGKNHS